MKKMLAWRWKGFVVLLIAACEAQAQDRPVVLVDIAPCMQIEADSLRHACFDDLASAARTALQSNAAGSPFPAATTAVAPVAGAAPATPGAPATATPAATPATASTAAPPATDPGADAAIAAFGASPSATSVARIESATDGTQQLFDRIHDLEEREPGRWLITLESGQVWYQSNSGRMRLRKNMEIRIYPSPLGGSWRLAGTDEASTGFIQVSRVR